MQDNYGFPADVYSFTILLWQILTNRVPFAKILCRIQFIAKVVHGKKRPNLNYVDDDRLRMLIESGWSEDPNRRPTFAVIINTLQEIIEYLSKDIMPEPNSALLRTRRERMAAILDGFSARRGVTHETQSVMSTDRTSTKRSFRRLLTWGRARSKSEGCLTTNEHRDNAQQVQAKSVSETSLGTKEHRKNVIDAQQVQQNIAKNEDQDQIHAEISEHHHTANRKICHELMDASDDFLIIF